jgi:hypothetical protein
MKTYKLTWICVFLLPALIGLSISPDPGEPTQNPFHRFQGEWVMKDGIFETYFDGVYSENVDTSRLLIAKSNTDFDILWHIDIVSSHGIIFWTFDNIRNEVHQQNCGYFLIGVNPKEGIEASAPAVAAG